MSKTKEIIVGTYEFGRDKKYGYVYANESFGGTNKWNKLIEKEGLANTELEVVLRVKK